MKALIIFVAAFLVVFASGFQNKNINANHYGPAAITSLMVASLNLLLFKYLPNITTVLEGAAYCVGGLLGVLSAMYLHTRLFNKSDKVEQTNNQINNNI